MFRKIDPEQVDPARALRDRPEDPLTFIKIRVIACLQNARLREFPEWTCR